MDLTNKTVLVTGSAKRIGKAIAEDLAQSGIQLALHCNQSREAAESFADELKQKHRKLKVKIFQADLNRFDDLTKLVDQVCATLGRLDVLINNASHYERTPLFEMTEKDWNVHLDVNLKAPFFLSREAAKRMKEKDGGLIINVADSETKSGWPGYLPYCVSKAALVSMTKGLAKTLAPDIRVNAIGPGTVLPPVDYNEEWHERALEKIPVNRFGDPRDIANMVRFLIEEGDYITGQLIRVDGGYSLK